MNAEAVNATITTVGWVAIHSLWQGLLVTGLLLLARRLLYYRPASLRYLTGCAALGLIATSAVVTAVLVLSNAESNRQIAEIASEKAGSIALTATPIIGPQVATKNDTRVTVPHLPHLSASDRLILVLDPWLPTLSTLAAVWCCGVGLLAGLQLLGAALAARIVRAAQPVSPERAERFRQLCSAFHAPDNTRFLISGHRSVRSPLTLGWRSPVVIIPQHIALRLAEPALDALVAHELVHVRRADYVANALQIGLEALLFFNPCVWWISSIIRNEREMCCDSEVKQECGEKVYANALAALADIEPHPSTPRHSLSAMGGAFLERIQAIAGTRSAGSRLAAAILSLCLVCSSFVGAAAVTKTIELRDLAFIGRTHESTVVFGELSVPLRDFGFAEALKSALRATKDNTLTSTEINALVAAFGKGADPDLVWQDFERVRRPGFYPTIAREFPEGWQWGEAGTQRLLGRTIWRMAKQLPDGPERRAAGRAALGIAAMRRETTSIGAVRLIVTDRQFSEICGLDSAATDRLRKYASGSSDLIGRSVVALRKHSAGSGEAAVTRIFQVDQQAIDLCRPRLPEIDFVDRELTLRQFTDARNTDLAIVHSLFTRSGPP